MTHVGLIYIETIFLDEYFATKKCGRVDLRIISPHTMPDSMQERTSLTCTSQTKCPSYRDAASYKAGRLCSPIQDIILDVKMITKMIKQGIMSEITILICDAPEGIFSMLGSSFLSFPFKITNRK